MPFKTSIHSFSRQLSKSLINSNLSQVHYCVTHTRLVYLTCLFVYINFSCSAVYCVCFFLTCAFASSFSSFFLFFLCVSCVQKSFFSFFVFLFISFIFIGFLYFLFKKLIFLFTCLCSLAYLFVFL